jgi:proprotein convertase subtilisin/kexin type 5
LSSSTGRCAPLPGYFESKIQIAGKCSADCQECSSPTACSFCAVGWYNILSNTCVTTCPFRYFSNFIERACKFCVYDCLTCDVSGACLSCGSSDNRILSTSTGRCVPKAGYYEKDGALVAVACPAGCLTCSSATQCSSCSGGYFLTYAGSCSISCPARQLLNSEARTC